MAAFCAIAGRQNSQPLASNISMESFGIFVTMAAQYPLGPEFMLQHGQHRIDPASSALQLSHDGDPFQCVLCSIPAA